MSKKTDRVMTMQQPSASPNSISPSTTYGIAPLDHLSRYEPTKKDIWMLGITIVIGGQYFSWNAGLTAGMYCYFIAYLLISTGYITLCFCTAEIAGALPFAGGAYGCLLYTSPSPRDGLLSRMPSSA